MQLELLRSLVVWINDDQTFELWNRNKNTNKNRLFSISFTINTLIMFFWLNRTFFTWLSFTRVLYLKFETRDVKLESDSEHVKIEIESNTKHHLNSGLCEAIFFITNLQSYSMMTYFLELCFGIIPYWQHSTEQH